MLKIRYSSSQWSIFLVIGLILIILGVVAISLPQLTAIAMFSVIGWVLLLSGFFQLFQLIGSDVSSWEYLIAPIFLAIFYGVVGMFVLMFPQVTVQLLSTVLSLFFFIGGLVKLYFAFQLRPGRYWHWLLLTGIIGLLIACYLLVTPSQEKTSLLGYLIGFYLLLHGLTLVFFSASLRGIK